MYIVKPGLLVALHVVAAFAQTGEINGRILTDSGQPVRGAVVSYSRLVAPRGVEAPLDALGRLGRNRQLHPQETAAQGLWVICASLAGSELLDPCPVVRQPHQCRGPGPTRSPRPGVRVVMPTRGQTFHVRLEDDEGLLPGKAKGRAENEVIVALLAKRGVFTLPVVSNDSAGRTHVVAVPSTSR